MPLDGLQAGFASPDAVRKSPPTALNMDSFGFVIHPLDARKDVARKYRLLGCLPTAWIHFISRYFPAVYISHVTGIRSTSSGKEIEGWLVSCPLTTRRLMTLPLEVAYKKIVRAGVLAQNLGSKIVGLGAFTSVVGDAGLTIAKNLTVPVTTGNSYTVAVTVRALFEAARRQGIDPCGEAGAVVGAAGAIGRACARLIGSRVTEMLLVGPSIDRLEEVRRELHAAGISRVRITQELGAVRDARLIVTAASSRRPIVESEHLSEKAVVCDVARPFNVSESARSERTDLRIVNGGMVKVPGPVDFGFDFGMPPGMAFACMAESMILALEGKYENYTIGRKISLEKVAEIDRMAAKHGFTTVLA
jgi:predicted amino acid dehydrogenase